MRLGSVRECWFDSRLRGVDLFTPPGVHKTKDLYSFVVTKQQGLQTYAYFLLT